MDSNLPEPTPVRIGPAAALARNFLAGLRAAFFLRVDAARWQARPGQFVALVAVSILASFASAFLLTGPAGRIDIHALPSEVFWIPLALLAGYLGARAARSEKLVWQIPVLAGAIATVFTVISTCAWFGLARGWIAVPLLLAAAYQVMFAWMALAMLLAVRRLDPAAPALGNAPMRLVALVFLLPLYFFPSDPLWVAEAEEGAPASVTFSEGTLYAQTSLLDDAEERLLPGRPGVEDLYFVGFAPYALQDVFMKETLAIGKLMDERFATSGRSIALISHPSLVDKYPIATLTSLRDVLQAIGERIDPEEDVVMVHLTTHGSQDHQLSVEFPPLDLASIRPQDLREALDDAGLKWRVVVVSACYSGGFIDALKDDHTLVMTASDASRTSFGCGNLFDYTYFSQALYDDALRRTRNFEQAFAMAKASIRARETREGLEPSNPQIFVGAAIREKLLRMERNGYGGNGTAI